MWRSTGPHSRLPDENIGRSSVIASEAKQSRGGGRNSGLLRRCAPRNDVERADGFTDRPPAEPSDPGPRSFAFSRRDRRPSSARNSPSMKQRAQGRPDAGWHPRPPCEQECTGQEPQVQPERPGLPCAMAYDLYALSSVHRACWPPSSTRCMGTSANLIPASGYQDHATSPSVPAALVSCSRPVHRTPPHVRDDAYAPRNEAG